MYSYILILLLCLVLMPYAEYCYITPFITFLFYIWSFFIKANFFNVRVKTTTNEKIKPSNLIKKTHYSVFVNFFSIQLLLLYVYLFMIRGYCFSFLWNQFYLFNFNITIIQISIFLLIILLFFLNSLTTNNVNYNIDFFFSISNITIFLILLNLSNNVLSFLFFLELNSILLFYKFVSSKYWYKSNLSIEESKTKQENRVIPQNYLNMLFFQYWSTFFSSALLFFSLAAFYFIYGSSEFVFINILSKILINTATLQNKLFTFIWLPFFLGFFIKIGLTPFHLYKIEVYKGLPIVTLLFYTTFYFFIYFVSFILLLNYNVNFIKICLNSYLYLFVFFGIIYVLILIFDITSLKSFFAYSTIINGLLFFIASYLF